jgi:amidohydrolase
MNQFYARAKELLPEMQQAQHTIHQFGGLGFDLRPSADFITAELRACGIEVREIAPCCLVAEIGPATGKTILLRADYDALPLEEQTGLPYAAKNHSCHACGHDYHATMLLYAAKLLKERESELQGRVRLMFQPAEETFAGGRMMCEHGVLDGVDAAFAMHIAAGREQSDACTIRYSRGATYSAVNSFKVTINGHGGHGALPHLTVDAVTIGARCILALQQLLAMERPADKMLVVSIGQFHSGNANNVIPDTSWFSGTIRTFDKDVRALALKRLPEIVEGTAKTMRAEAVVELDREGGDPVVNNRAMAEEIFPYMEDVTGAGKTALLDEPASFGSEDFCFVSGAVPSVIIALGAGSIGEGYTYGMHNPHVRFDDNALAVGAATHANVVFNWLKNHR